MNNLSNLANKLHLILNQYQLSFTQKSYDAENEDHDLLMDVFSLTPEMKRENRQYWGRELGMCWQLLVTEIFRHTRLDFGPGLKFNSDEPCDLIVGNYALDTKYRIGSGDSGTLKKFKAYGPLLQMNGYTPVLLILRTDNLPSAITACLNGGWSIYTGDATLDFIRSLTNFDVAGYLAALVGKHTVTR
ncbi:MAG: restriction endonuclease [Ardenticatenales bacterium]|nr:restriction endonuclease [Ardenticatenales bacterium]